MFHTLKNNKMAIGILNYSNDLEYNNTFHCLHSNILHFIAYIGITMCVLRPVTSFNVIFSP